MLVHANAKLGLAGRLALVSRIEEGRSLRSAAAAFNVSPATAHRWWHRWIDGGRRPQSLLDRSSRPRYSPRLLAPELAERICACRRATGWGPRLVAGATGFAHSTVSRVLWRAGISAPRGPPLREPANRYEWPCPGDLLHMDVSRYARFERPGHAVTGDRSQALARLGANQEPASATTCPRRSSTTTPGSAYVELRDDETAATVTGFIERAGLLREPRDHAKRVMTDNAFDYVKNRTLRELLADRGITHLTNAALSAPHQRQGRALPPDHGPRMGLRPHLPLTPTPRPSAATLARPLQPATTAQRTRRLTPDQPRS